MSEAGPSKPRLRANKACENCRLRKIKCSGTTPCDPCKSTGIGAQCSVRTKARPNRPVPAILAQAQHELRGAIPDYASADPGLSVPIRIPLQRVDPLEYLREYVKQWGTENGLNAELLLFHDHPRLVNMIATPLPPFPERIDFEDGLIKSLVSADGLEHLECLDSPRLVDLYLRHRASPEALTEDQDAVIYASLCLARYTQLRRGAAGGVDNHIIDFKEDLTYYRMARSSLDAYGKASITSMWALFCLAMFVQLYGGPGEYGEMTALWAWHIQELGLHKREIAQLYPAQDMSETLLASYCYGETLRSIMTDLTPAIPLAQVDLDPDRIPNGISHSMARASNHAVRYLRDYAKSDADITSNTYIAEAEEALSSDLAFLRAQKMTGMARIKQGWAEMRIHWLRILLYIPLVQAESGRSGPALMTLARSLVNILNTHMEAAHAGKLDPSWPQLIRIMTCGQLLILCSARGEMHSFEAGDMFGKLVALLEAHTGFWPTIQDAILGFRLAAARFGTSQGQNFSLSQDIVIPDPNGPADVAGPLSRPIAPQDDIDWSAMFMDMDMGSFVDVQESGALFEYCEADNRRDHPTSFNEWGWKPQ